MDDVYIAQNNNWDCGPACVYMALRYVGHTDVEYAESSKPMWTIELFMMLNKSSNCNFTFYTLCEGVAPHHFCIDWYSSSIERDEVDINRLFKDAQQRGWPIEKGTVSQELLKHNLSLKACIILLVDYNILMSVEEYQKQNIGNSGDDSSPSNMDNTSYMGHFILLISYDEKTNEYLYLDPASKSPELQRRQDSVIEKARSHRGTDQDLIVCSAEQRQCTTNQDSSVIKYMYSQWWSFMSYLNEV